MKKTVLLLLTIAIFTLLLLLSSCAFADKDFAPGFGGSYAPSGDFSDGAPEMDSDASDVAESEDNGDSVRLPAGMMTAGAWNDNTYYSDWLKLFLQDETKNGKFYDYTKNDLSWGYNSLNRVSVSVMNGEAPVAGAGVTAYDKDGNTLFAALTDAQGKAYLFPTASDGSISVTNGTETVSCDFTEQERDLSVELSTGVNKLNVIEIMLVVDVTGSMSDELEFLKTELQDVISRISSNDSDTVIKLAMLFYRDINDDVPFTYYDFADVTTLDGLNAQQAALDTQRASGGGDYPEAVDRALDMAVNKQWSTGATTKIIFHVLDAPAHDEPQNKQLFADSVEKAAELGIRICPIICSGASSDTEYTMREAAIYTGGTFIFITDDSGIGGSHHDPELPNATVELLNSLMVRLANGYHTGVFTEPVYWKDDPGLSTMQ